MSEPDKSPNNPRWLNEISDELRESVPVRAAWRSRLLDEVAHARRPSAGDAYDDRVDDTSVGMPHAARPSRGIVIRPLTAIAAAVLFAALGAGVTYATLSARGAARSNSGRQPSTDSGFLRKSGKSRPARCMLASPSPTPAQCAAVGRRGHMPSRKLMIAAGRPASSL